MTFPNVLRTLRWPLAIGLVLLMVYAFRYALLRQLGDFLVTEDEAVRADALYVLGGASLERGIEAARIMDQGWASHAWFTGSNISSALLAEGIEKEEGRVGRDVAIRHGADPARVHFLPKGTSTQEEAIAVLAHADSLGFDTILVLSTHFHLRRVAMVFKDDARARGIEVALRPAPSIYFDRERWWESEDGLIMLNNEYVKLLYYAWRY